MHCQNLNSAALPRQLQFSEDPRDSLRLIMRDGSLSADARVIHWHICDHGWSDGFSWPFVRTLAEYLGKSEWTVYRAVKELVDAGLLRVEKQWHRNYYFPRILAAKVVKPLPERKRRATSKGASRTTSKGASPIGVEKSGKPSTGEPPGVSAEPPTLKTYELKSVSNVPPSPPFQQSEYPPNVVPPTVGQDERKNVSAARSEDSGPISGLPTDGLYDHGFVTVVYEEPEPIQPGRPTTRNQEETDSARESEFPVSLPTTSDMDNPPLKAVREIPTERAESAKPKRKPYDMTLVRLIEKVTGDTWSRGMWITVVRTCSELAIRAALGVTREKMALESGIPGGRYFLGTLRKMEPESFGISSEKGESAASQEKRKPSAPVTVSGPQCLADLPPEEREVKIAVDKERWALLKRRLAKEITQGEFESRMRELGVPLDGG